LSVAAVGRTLRGMARRPIVPSELMRGPFTLVEAARAGLSWKQLQGASWRRLDTGMYVWAGLADSPLLSLAAICRRLPAAAAFSGRTAGWLHGLDLSPCNPVEVSVPPTCGVSIRSGVSIHRTELLDSEITNRRGLPATSALRTLADLAGRSTLTEAVVIADMALHASLVRLHELRTYSATHQRRRGVAQLRRIAEFAEPAAESPMETRLRMLLVLSGLPRPQVQVSLHDERQRFVGRVDLYYPEQRLAVEYDGGIHRDKLVDDDRRQNRLLDAGYLLLRFTAGDVLRQPASVVGLVRSAIR
jgi:very-short-patch-repair endonuclease